MAKKKNNSFTKMLDYDQMALDLGVVEMIEPVQKLNSAVDDAFSKVKEHIGRAVDGVSKNDIILVSLSGVRQVRAMVNERFESVEDELKKQLDPTVIEPNEVISASFAGVTNVECHLKEDIAITLGVNPATKTKFDNESFRTRLSALGLPDKERDRVVEEKKTYYFQKDEFLALEKSHKGIYEGLINEGSVKVVRGNKIMFE